MTRFSKRSLAIPRVVASLVILTMFSFATFAADTVSVATFNCEFLVHKKVHIKFGHPFTLRGADKTLWDQSGFRDARFLEATRAVAARIRALDADVIALTEVGDAADVQLLRDEIASLGLNYPHVFVGDSTDNTTGQHVAVLSKRPLLQTLARIPGREGYYEELDDPDTEKDTGVSKGLRVVFNVDNGIPVHLIVAHLASERGGHEQDRQRVAQASLVRRFYLPFLNAGEHVIVAGDLNDGRGQPALRRIRGFDDIHGDLIQTGHHRFSDDTELGERWTYEFRGERNQIDHLLISRSIYDACGKSNVVPEFFSTTGTIAGTVHAVSDHRALSLTLTFP